MKLPTEIVKVQEQPEKEEVLEENEEVLEENEEENEDVSNIMKEWVIKKDDSDLINIPVPDIQIFKTSSPSKKIVSGRIEITPVSLIQQRKNEQRESRKVQFSENTTSENISLYQQRCNAFELLGDKNVMKEQLVKTRMCSSATSGTKCPHGTKCRFAHSEDELNPNNCCFGNNCKLVKNVEGVIENSKSSKKICFFIHTGETKEQYRSRICSKPVSIPSEKNLVVEETVKKVFIPAPVKVSCWKKPEIPVFNSLIDTTKEINIRVPISVVEEAMKAILDSGFTRIKLVVY